VDITRFENDMTEPSLTPGESLIRQKYSEMLEITEAVVKIGAKSSADKIRFRDFWTLSGSDVDYAGLNEILSVDSIGKQLLKSNAGRPPESELAIPKKFAPAL
jgi:hypothetical protein